MTTIRTISSLAAGATLALASPAFAATDAEHDSHHPASEKPAATTVAQAKPAAPAASMPPMQAGPAMQGTQGMQAQMKAMQEMHARMMAAKTPEERNALMAEHMKAMQGGMKMMQGMSGMGGMGPASAPARGMPADMAQRQQMMEQRMDMMTMMMEMMMDRLPAAPAK